MILPEINHIIGGTKTPGVPIWDEITRAYAVQSGLYWEGVKKRAVEYRAAVATAAGPTSPPYRRTCLACM